MGRGKSVGIFNNYCEVMNECLVWDYGIHLHHNTNDLVSSCNTKQSGCCNLARNGVSHGNIDLWQCN